MTIRELHGVLQYLVDNAQGQYDLKVVIKKDDGTGYAAVEIVSIDKISDHKRTYAILVD